ncbi:MAG: B12-binding domain-containing radical SAM protein [Defluviitaleaceae bacterium]|nr:B12-binding domain-containing radical SAM protein [Defluviitaleaceae bacterium]MCL2238340.1 B12-binding domain-containing radical SAM protein [Defluviitaleaceae bacterium]
MKNILVVLKYFDLAIMESTQFIPLGIIYIATVLKRNRYNVITLTIKENDASHMKYIEILDETIKKHNIDVVCSGALSPDHWFIKNMFKTVKSINKNIVTILGGGGISSNPKIVYEDTLTDYGIINEGEFSIIQLMKHISGGGGDTEIINIPGLVYKNHKGETIINPSSNIENLDAIPFPDFTLFPEFEKAILKTGEYPILLSRSCPFKCTFCFHTCGSTYRKRSLDNIFQEISFAVNRYKIRKIYLNDELFIDNKERIKDFCERIKKFNLSFNGQTRADVITKETLVMLKEAGCKSIGIGLESMNNDVLKSMKKRVTRQQIDDAYKMTKEIGLSVGGNIIVGDIAESLETADESIKWFVQNYTQYNLDIINIRVLPGTELYNYAVKKGIIKCETEYINSGNYEINITNMSDEEFAYINKKIAQLGYCIHRGVEFLEVININRESHTVDLNIECLSCRKAFIVNDNPVDKVLYVCPYCHSNILLYMKKILKEHDLELSKDIEAVEAIDSNIRKKRNYKERIKNIIKKYLPFRIYIIMRALKNRIYNK